MDTMRRNLFKCYFAVMVIVLALWVHEASAAEVLTIGGQGQISWQGRVASDAAVDAIKPEYRSPFDPQVTEIGNTPSDLIDFNNAEFPNSILPGQVGDGQNISTAISGRGGGISSPTVFDISDAQLRGSLEQLITASPTGKAFERKGNFVLGTLLVIDLGGRFGVNQLRFFPRNTVFSSPGTPFQGDFLKNFEVHINDGVILTKAGNPIWEFYEGRMNNDEAVTTIDIDPPRLLRFLRLRATSSIPFEVEKIQIFGEGFFPTARYLSPVVDLGSPANWGQLRWLQSLVGQGDKVDMQIRSRTGTDETPLTYTRKRVGLKDAQEITLSVDNPDQPLGRREYLKLPEKGGQSDVWERGSVRDDLEHWSPWTSPYSLVDGISPTGTKILSPGPRRYIQFRVDFLSNDLSASYVLGELSFDYTSPPLADALIGEIFPRDVAAAEDISFVYALRTEMQTGEVQGFDTFELQTGTRVTRVERVEIIDRNGVTVVDHTFAEQEQPTVEGNLEIASITDDAFSVKFPLIVEHGSVLKIYFVSRVLSFSTTFEGRALLAAEEAFQGVIAGDADLLAEDDISYKSDVTVLSPSVNTGSLIGSIALGTPVITPNGDKVNDQLVLSYEILAVVGTAGIRVEVVDLGGRPVRSLFDGLGQNGVYDAKRLPALAWDGRDEHNELVPPGLYLVRIEVEGDARASATVRSFGVSY
jgi:hypothetical protein